jgi:hypothetical protein
LGARVPYLFAVTDTGDLSDSTVERIRNVAFREARVPVIIGPNPMDGTVTWNEFLEAFGGEVPSWRALSDDYPLRLETLAVNKLPKDESGEAWRLFEGAVADGLEFVLGRRVTRLGGGRRGQRVSDILVNTPDSAVCVVDAKAYESPFNVTAPALRSLGEYVTNQVTRQQGQNTVGSAILVAAAFQQNPESLLAAANGFLADYRVPLALIEIETLNEMVRRMSESPHLRSAIRWRQILCRIGLVEKKLFSQELEQARLERQARDGR